MLTLIEDQDRHAEQRESVVRGLDSLSRLRDGSDLVFCYMMQTASMAAKSCTTHSALERVLKMTIEITTHLSPSEAARGQLVELLGRVESWKTAP